MQLVHHVHQKKKPKNTQRNNAMKDLKDILFESEAEKIKMDE